MSVTRYDGATADDIADPVRMAIEDVDRHEASARHVELEGRRMVMPTSQVTLRVEVHVGHGRTCFLMDVANNIRWSELEKAVRGRCGNRLPLEHSFFYLDSNGGLVELNGQPAFSEFVLAMWCSHPWVLHAHEGGTALQELACLIHETSARRLFDRYDVDSDGKITRREMLALLDDLHLDRLQIPRQLVERFVDVELCAVACCYPACACAVHFSR